MLQDEGGFEDILKPLHRLLGRPLGTIAASIDPVDPIAPPPIPAPRRNGRCPLWNAGACLILRAPARATVSVRQWPGNRSDITERQSARGTSSTSLREINSRQGIYAQIVVDRSLTRPPPENPEDFVRALSEPHPERFHQSDLLVRKMEWVGIAYAVSAQLAHFADSRLAPCIAMHGPKLRLEPAAARRSLRAS